jgi:hypothetical protein
MMMKKKEEPGVTHREICRPLDLRLLESLHAHVRLARKLAPVLVLLRLSRTRSLFSRFETQLQERVLAAPAPRIIDRN